MLNYSFSSDFTMIKKIKILINSLSLHFQKKIQIFYHNINGNYVKKQYVKIHSNIIIKKAYLYSFMLETILDDIVIICIRNRYLKQYFLKNKKIK